MDKMKGENLLFFCWVCLLSVFFFKNTAKAQVSGMVFHDINYDGTRNPLPAIEPLQAGVKVSAFVGTSIIPLQKITDANGVFSFSSIEITAGSKVRLEFSDPGTDAFIGSFAGTQNGSAVQFLTAPVNNVAMAVSYPEDFCAVNGMTIFTSCYVMGDPLAGGSAGEEPAIVTFPYDANGASGKTGPKPIMIAKTKTVGSCWGSVANLRRGVVFKSAIVRRFSGLGPLGTGGIYKIQLKKIAGKDSSEISHFIDLKSLGINTGNDPHSGLTGNMLDQYNDAASIPAAGRTGIGGLALSFDSKEMALVNLFDRKLYLLHVGDSLIAPTSASQVKSYAIPNPGCLHAADARAFGVKQYKGKYYLGAVCSGETDNDSTQLKGNVVKFDPITEQFSTIFQFPLTYKRGSADHTNSCVNIKYWRAWTDVYPKACSTFNDGNGTVGFALNPMPIISDIEFDTDGSLIIGLTDRFGLMSGYRNQAPVSDGIRYDGFVSGDLLRAQYDNVTKTFAMESNGQSGSLTGCGVGSNQGPDGGEFFCNDVWLFFGKPAHSEIANGGVIMIKGTGEVMTSTMDPVNEVYQSSGVRVFNSANGNLKRSYSIYDQQAGSLGKSGGVGDISGFCSPPPIEIGNRVWNDKNDNGIQDPDELGIDNVIVTLHDMENGGVQIAQATTINGGLYYFNNSNVSQTLTYLHHYEIRLSINQPTLSAFKKFSPSDVNNGGSNPDYADSDPVVTGGIGAISITTPGPGIVDHNQDFGLFLCNKPNAGRDTTLCASVSAYKLANAPQNNYWKIVAGNPAIASVDSLTGQVSGMTKPGKYQFQQIFLNASMGCQDTVAITIVALLTYSIAITQTTCTGLTPNNDGKITLTKFTTGDKYDLVKANTYTGTLTFASAKVIPADGILLKNLLNPTANETYAVRVINQYGCVAKDSSIVLNKNICSCTKPNAGKDTLFCMPKPTYKLATAGTNQYWKTIAGNPVSTTIDSLSGQIAGMTKGGVYKFRLINGLDPKYACDDTVAIKLVEPPVFSVDSYTPTCAGPTANNDGKIFIAAFNNSDKYDIQKAGTYTGSLTFNLAKLIPADGILLKNIPNSLTNDQYVVRLINKDNCYIDKPVLLLASVCTCVANICIPVNIVQIKSK